MATSPVPLTEIIMEQRASTTAMEGMSAAGCPAVFVSLTTTGMATLPSVSVSKVLKVHQNVPLGNIMIWSKSGLVWWTVCLHVLTALDFKSDVKTVSALLDQFYEKRRLLIVSAPNITDPDYQMQNIMIQVRKHTKKTRHTHTVTELIIVDNPLFSLRNPTVAWTCDT